MPPTIYTAKIREVDVRAEGSRVLVLEEGDLVFDLPWDAALALAQALRLKAKQAEEDAKALQIIEDQALLHHLGIPLGLSSRPDIQDASLKRAVGLGGVRSQEIFGRPRIIQHPPRSDE
jgi:hypothetical protein